MGEQRLNRNLEAAIAALRAGELVVYPTETFYGLAADPESSASMEALLSLKGRDPDKPIALIAADSESAFALAREIPLDARRLAAAFWPGPLTLVLPARPGLHPALVGAGGVGVRVSSHPLARALAAGLGRPITATSANLAGQPPISAPDQLRAVFADKIKVILEDGILSGGAPSTVIEFVHNNYRIVRPGAIAEPVIAEALTATGAPR
ncbi:MAG TPA: L-threonylcarbamoyladenylate synthase [Candidatus Binataceae bacterium]|nr:L-threonylcarbamoyladenylate synthase [Candidatus Binataceae bacterium]